MPGPSDPEKTVLEPFILGEEAAGGNRPAIDEELTRGTCHKRPFHRGTTAPPNSGRTPTIISEQKIVTDRVPWSTT